MLENLFFESLGGDLPRVEDEKGKFKFPVTFHDGLESIEEAPDLLSLDPPKKKEKQIKVIELGKKNKNKKGLF
jgi:hypothetical protein